VIVRLEIYNNEKKLRNALERIKNSSIDQKNKAKILEFYRECLAQGLSQARIIKYLGTLERIARALNKPFEEVVKEDIAELIRKIESRNYSDWTKHDYKVIIKIFYRWLRRTEDYPEEVRWIKTGKKKNNTLPEELLTEEEVKQMAEVASNLRDKAFILVLYESGCRIGEILSLNVKNVQFDQYGAQLIVSGKTGMRRVRIVASAPKLAQWLENHPLKEDPDAPLWVSIGTRDRNSALSYSAAKAALKEIAKRAGIRKRVYPHLFRHSRATMLANHLTEAQLKQHFGWEHIIMYASISRGIFQKI
jgi:integrase